MPKDIKISYFFIVQSILIIVQVHSVISLPPPRYALSSTYLIYIAQADQIIYSEIKKYTTAARKRLELADAYLKDYEESSLKGTDHIPSDKNPWFKAMEVASNPLLSYRMIRRFTKEFSEFENNFRLNESLENGLLETIKKLKGSSGFPDSVEYKDSVDTILRLQLFYDLNTDELSKGKVMDIQSKVELKHTHTHELGQGALKNHQYSLALEWFKTTRRICKRTRNVCTFDELLDLSNNYKALVIEHDKKFENPELKESTPFMYTSKLSVNPNAPTVKQIKTTKYRGDKNKENEEEIKKYNFMTLCKEGDFLTAKEKSTLRCWLDTKRNPYFRIFPLKIEQLHKYPYVIQIYDIVSNAWILDMSRKATPSLLRPPPDSPGGATRTAIYTWLENEDIPKSPLAKRVELVTGLRDAKNSTDLIQVTSYAFGAYVSTHIDYLGYSGIPYTVHKGDRLGTFLLYMSDVKQGGGTAFPRLGISAQPRKGSAIFWYTTKRNGQVDLRTVHGSCPVVYGHKWIVTKWTDQNLHFLSRYCETTPPSSLIDLELPVSFNDTEDVDSYYGKQPIEWG